MLNLIVAMSEKNRAIGLDGDLPWKLRADLRRFKAITTGHTVVMGRKTWESIPEKFRPLPDRKNVVLSRDPDYIKRVPDGVGVSTSLTGTIRTHRRLRASPVADQWGELFVIGGQSVFEEALPHADRLYLTLVDYEGPGDVFFPEDPFQRFEPVPEEKEVAVPADEKNSHASRFLVLRRRTATIRKPPPRLAEFLSIVPDVRGGRPCLRSRPRFLLSQVLAEIEDRDSWTDVARDYEIDPEEVREVLQKLARWFDQPFDGEFPKE